ncbi:hypothetical protein VNO78_19269 [Psophocarpus tetragonolobus]|uniref:Helicase C-terminal domain-containing protein n=1 Tax=Psophocarpus tetragonolobus TaxID=3891 RepID=A0AAN9XFS5_PSOTE
MLHFQMESSIRFLEVNPGLNMLTEITNAFTDVYDNANFYSVPGLQIYTLLMNTTDMQCEILIKLQTRMAECNRYPLELELLVTLGSIHPLLVKTARWANKFFTLDQLKQLEKTKFDLKIESKVKFVFCLVFPVMEKEKVLIFCHSLALVKLLVELFEMFFKWEKHREVLVLIGELDLLERGKVRDKFEDPKRASKVLFASITACAEGINLTTASRMIFLDSEESIEDKTGYGTCLSSWSAEDDLQLENPNGSWRQIASFKCLDDTGNGCGDRDISVIVQSMIRKMLSVNETQECSFNNCLHLGEPGCIVKGDWEIYSFYFQLLDEIKVREDFQLRTSRTKREGDGRYH